MAENIPFESDRTHPTDAEADATEKRATVDEAEDLQTQLVQAQDRALRLQADLENLRRRSARDLAEQSRYANLPLMRDLLPVTDNVARAIEAAEKTHDVEQLLEGVKLIAQQLEKALTSHHCMPIDALNQPFDPNRHEAISQQPTDEQPPGTVVTVAQPGYELHDRVIRPSQVIVATSPSGGE